MIITNSSSLLAPDNKERESARWFATNSSISSVGDKISLSGELCSLSGELLFDDDSNLDAVEYNK